MLSNHLAVPSTSYSSRSDPQSNLELESLRDNNRQLSEALARARQELSVALENENSLKAKYLNLHVKYCRLEKVVRTNVHEICNFLNEPRPYNQVDETRRNSTNDFLSPIKSQGQKTVKTQLVRPTINGVTIQVPRITLDRLQDIELNYNSQIDVDSSSSESDAEENEAPELHHNNEEQPTELASDENQANNIELSNPSSQEGLFGPGNTDVDNYLSRLISAQEQGIDEPDLTTTDTMENVRIVLERLPTNISLGPLPEEPSNSNLTTPVESSSTSTDVNLVSQPTNTSLTNMVDSATEMQQSVLDTQLNGTGCSSDSAHSSSVSRSNTFSSLSQLAAMKMLGLELTSSQKSSSSSVRSRLRRARKTNQSTSPPQQKNRKRKLNPKCSGTSIRKNRISDDRIVMVLLDRKEMSKLLLLRNPVVRIGRTLDNKTSSKRECRSTKRKITTASSGNQEPKATPCSDVGSQTRKLKRKPKNRQSDVVSESFIKRNLSVKVTKLKAI
ncbi:unnamed protein product [Callosobruchus maculatus]|uniref:Uncharacterized protein n=1 Tax=Callosobruchus maculatus TaxID=64391 RepID=A0A653CWI0_CALMS|nr:unnamed protein product [Callosobruchus maculatus]